MMSDGGNGGKLRAESRHRKPSSILDELDKQCCMQIKATVAAAPPCGRRKQTAGVAGLKTLTGREREVMSFVITGRMNKRR
jgi:FixJ family two-component response regulator